MKISKRRIALLAAAVLLLSLTACNTTVPDASASLPPSPEATLTPMPTLPLTPIPPASPIPTVEPSAEPSPSPEPPESAAPPEEEPSPEPSAEPSASPEATPSPTPLATPSPISTPAPSSSLPTPSHTPSPTPQAPSPTPKPVSTVLPTGIKLEQTYIVLNVGDTVTVRASVLPAEAANKYAIGWESTSKYDTHTEDGIVTGTAPGAGAMWAYVYDTTTGKKFRNADGEKIEVKVPMHVNDPNISSQLKPYQKEYDIAAIQADMKKEVEARGWTWNPELTLDNSGFYAGIDTSTGYTPELLRKMVIGQLNVIEQNDPSDYWSIYFVFTPLPNGEYNINCLRS